MQDNSEILTVPEMAELLKISRTTAYEWVHIAGFPALRVGNCIRVPRGLLMDWVASQATKMEG